MPISSDVVGWYIKNIIIPNFVQYDKPAFVITEQKTKYGYTYQRDIFLSERFLINFENNIVDKLGNRGKAFLYEVGKNFGWNYGKSFKVPNLKNSSSEEVVEIAKFLAKFVGGTWAKETTIDRIDVENMIFQIRFKDFVICSHNGKGFMLTEGGLAGLWAWMMSNPEVEGNQTQCEGRGDEKCICVCAPLTKNSMDSRYAISKKIIESECDTEEYRSFNKVRPAKFSSMSMKRMISSGLVSYTNGKMQYKATRFFPLGIDFIFLLESIAKDREIKEILYQTAFNEGMEFALNEKSKNTSFIQDTLSSQGWGDLAILDSNKKVAVQFYPWHPLFQESNKEVFLGYISGIVSGVIGKQVRYNIKSENLRMGHVSFELEAHNYE